MEKVNKAKVIARAFTQESNIDKNVLEHRRKICSGCEFNSDNANDKELGFIEKARKKLLKGEPFCTACGCQVNEKTTQETEECGLGEKGLEPKWNRIRVETTDSLEIDLVNKSVDIVNVDLSKDKKAFEISFKNIFRKDIKEICFLLQSKNKNNLEVNYVTPSCGSCTSSSFDKKDDNTCEVKVELNTSKISKGQFRKNVYIGYKINGKYKKNQIRLTGILK